MSFESKVACIIHFQKKYINNLKQDERHVICRKVDTNYPNNNFRTNMCQFLINIGLMALHGLCNDVSQMAQQYPSVQLKQTKFQNIPFDIFVNIGKFLIRKDSSKLGNVCQDFYCHTRTKTFIISRRSAKDKPLPITSNTLSVIKNDFTSSISYYYPINVQIDSIDHKTIDKFMANQQHYDILNRLLSMVQYINCPFNMLAKMPVKMLFDKNLREVELNHDSTIEMLLDNVKFYDYAEIAAKWDKHRNLNKSSTISIHELRINSFYTQDYEILKIMKSSFENLYLYDGKLDAKTQSEWQMIFHTKLKSLSWNLGDSDCFDIVDQTIQSVPLWQIMKPINNCPMQELSITHENVFNLNQQQNIESLFKYGICNNLSHLIVNVSLMVRVIRPMVVKKGTLCRYNHKTQRYGWLYKLLNPNEYTIQCPSKLKTVTINTCVHTHSMLSELKYDIAEIAKWKQKPSCIHQLQIHIELIHFKGLNLTNNICDNIESKLDETHKNDAMMINNDNYFTKMTQVTEWIDNITENQKYVVRGEKTLTLNFT